MAKEIRKYSTWKDSKKNNNDGSAKKNDNKVDSKRKRTDKEKFSEEKIEKGYPKRVLKEDFILNKGKKRSGPAIKPLKEDNNVKGRNRIKNVGEKSGKSYARPITSSSTEKEEKQKYNIHSVGKKSDYNKQPTNFNAKSGRVEDKSKKPDREIKKPNFDNRLDKSFDSKEKSANYKKDQSTRRDTPINKTESKHSNKEFVKRKNTTENADDKSTAKTPSSKSMSKKGETGPIRLNRYISNAGVCSRRDADKLIQEGLIKVNGEVITELGYKVNPGDSIKYGNKVLRREKFVYVLLNKPKDFITTMEDPEERKTVMDLVKNACPERVFPVGRLDRNTTGLLLLTNDGELASKLTHPKYEIKKIYQVEIDSPLKTEDLEAIMNGLELEDGPVIIDDIEVISKDKKTIGLEIHEGRNRIVRRIFEHLGYEVVNLDRVVYAGLTKKDLPRGKWRLLSEKEVIALKYLR